MTTINLDDGSALSKLFDQREEEHKKRIAWWEWHATRLTDAWEQEKRFSRQALNVIESIARELGVPTNNAPAEGLLTVLDECRAAIRTLRAGAKVTP
jgi:hypothetical protein